MRVVAIGAGAWGKNIIRNLAEIGALGGIVDGNADRLNEFGEQYPQAALFADYRAALESDCEAVAIATPTPSHFEIAMAALEAGKDVFVEKPLTHSSAQARQLVDAARHKNAILMVGHLLIYQPAIAWIRDYVAAGEIGELFSIRHERLNLGRARSAENVIWDIGVHDMAIMLYLVGMAPDRVRGTGHRMLGLGVEDEVHVHLEFENGVRVVRQSKTVTNADGTSTTTVTEERTGRDGQPLDLVAAFRPTTLDTSYKPGVDALRLDLFQGVSGQLTLLGAYLGDWEFDQSALVAHGKGSLGDWELEGFVGGLYGDLVLGTSVFYNAGAVGLYGDLNVTLPEDDSFIRALVGVQFKPSESTHLNAEVYIQTLGASEADGYLLQYTSPRFARGELWLAGELYGAVAGQLELTPLVSLSGALIVNPLDASALIMPSLVWSVSDNATANLGALVGHGRASAPAGPPVGLRLRSEFGHLPSTAFLSASVYF